MKIDPLKRYLPELDPDNQNRAYTRLTRDGRSCIFEPEEAAAIMRDEPGVYSAHTEMMPPSLYRKLPEFSGW